MKPKMLIWGGFGWCASSPLVYTLQRNAKYAHFGYTKVWNYFKEENKGMLDFYQVFDGTWENYKSHEEPSHRLNLTVDLEPLRDFSLSHLKKLMESERTEKNLIDFYHALYDHVITKGYKSVGDYNYRSNCVKGDEKKYNELLMSEFDIKVLAIVRDPIRRTFSRYLNKKRMAETENLLLSNLNWKGTTMKITDYTKKINALYETFGRDRTHVTVMEELWEGDGTAKKELSQFLDHPITNLWKNLYAPDRGHLVEYDKDVPCQAYGQNLAELTPEMYYQYRKENDHIYQAWKQEFGSLPLHWGEPIEYS
ncbi:MAG: hypothetical protein CL761_05585 [Chloroflexi bacterium]|nr:hypothetical protein [Chloroflexota bacterium]|tara:strand:+ start:4503 stop:5429 length:927 start_codon:yes stop_codon:yes gene_type:complete